MDFSEQFETMVEAWSTGQRRMWEGWYSLFPMLTSSPGVGDPSEGRSPHEKAAQVRQATLSDSSSAWSWLSSLAEGLSAGYSAMLRMLEVSTTAWTSMASEVVPTAEVGDFPDWQTLLNGYTKPIRPWMLELPAVNSPQDLVRLWRLSFEQLRKLHLEELDKLSKPWFEVLRPVGSDGDQTAAADQSALSRFSNLYWDACERTLGRLLESPSVGHTRELDEGFLRSSDTWLEFRRASFEYVLVLAEAWSMTVMELTSELLTRAQKGQPVTSLQELLRLWTEVADRVLIDIFSTERFARAQGVLLNAAMAYRLQEREAVDAFLKMSHLPTRSEMDEVTQDIMELRRELQGMLKNRKDSSAQVPQPGQQEPRQSQPQSSPTRPAKPTGAARAAKGNPTSRGS